MPCFHFCFIFAPHIKNYTHEGNYADPYLILYLPVLLFVQRTPVSPRPPYGRLTGTNQPQQCPFAAKAAERQHRPRTRRNPHVLPPALHQGARQSLHRTYLGQPHPAGSPLLPLTERPETPARSTLLCRTSIQRPGGCAAGAGVLPTGNRDCKRKHKP